MSATKLPSQDVLDAGLKADWSFLESFVPSYNRVWTSTPLVKTADTVWAPLMGNGNMSVCISGDDDTQVYYMRTADFWTDDGESDGQYHQNNLGDPTGDGQVREIPSGCLKISVGKDTAPAPLAEQSLAYRQEEDILNAEIRSSLPFSGCGLKMTSFVAATENTMVVELSSVRPVRVNVELNTDVLDKVAAYPASAGVDGNVLYLTRETSNRSGARWISRNAYAVRIFGVDRVTLNAGDTSRTLAAFEMPANAVVRIVVCLDGGKNATNPLSAARTRVAGATEKGVTGLKESHRNWWKTNWWLKSYVRTYDDVMDKYYFRCLYLLGTMCREGYVNSGLHGPWKASDTLHNYSSYCMNDLGAASYYLPLISSDRASVAKMWIQTVYDWIPEGQRRAIKHAGLTRGVFFPVHWAPWGSTYSDVYWGQKFCASFASLVGNWYYRNTEDVEYLRERIYPFMKECANFYEDWLTKEADGKYHVRGASYEFATDNYQNSCIDLIYANILFTDIVKYSKVLGVDSDRRAKWEDIRDHLNEFSTTSRNGMTVYQADSTTSFDLSVNVIQTQVVYPGYTSNRRSAPGSREIGYSTIRQAIELSSKDGLGQDNMRGQGSFVAAQRCGGFKVEELIARYKAMLVSRPVEYTGYIADAGLWEFNNQLCMQCYADGVMFFPDYPSDRKLSFKRLRAPGAFLCSGEFRDGAAADLAVYSEKGNEFTVIGPWGETCAIEVLEVGGKPIPTRKDADKYTFDTVAGETYRITRKAL